LNPCAKFCTSISAPDCPHRKRLPLETGPLPADALKAFQELQSILFSEPVVDYPHKDRPYTLNKDAGLGDEKNAEALEQF